MTVEVAASTAGGRPGTPGPGAAGAQLPAATLFTALRAILRM